MAFGVQDAATLVVEQLKEDNAALQSRLQALKEVRRGWWVSGATACVGPFPGHQRRRAGGTA